MLIDIDFDNLKTTEGYFIYVILEILLLLHLIFIPRTQEVHDGLMCRSWLKNKKNHNI